MQRDIVALQAQFDDLRSEKERLQKTIAAAESQNTRLEELMTETTAVLRRNNADFGVVMDELQQETQQLRGTIEKLNYELDLMREEQKNFKEEMYLRMGIKPAQAKRDSDSPSVPPPTLPEDKDDLYAHAFERYQAGDFIQAERAFSSYVEQFPRDKRAENAVFFTGDILFQQKKYEDVIVTLQKILKDYPDGSREAESLFQIGLSFMELGRCKDGHLFLDELIRKFPNLPVSKEAGKIKRTRRCR